MSTIGIDAYRVWLRARQRSAVQWDPEVGAPKFHCEDDRCHQCRVLAFDNLPLKGAPLERIGLTDREGRTVRYPFLAGSAGCHCNVA